MRDTTITKEEQFTGAKTSEYAVFYNIAFWWMSDMIEKLYKTENASSNMENQDDHSPYLDRFNSDGENPNETSLSDASYLRLRDYLWKGYLFDKNSSGLELTEKDKRLIHKIIKKLVEIRNFHSHYWHDNENLLFDTELMNWVDHLHIYALEMLEKENGFEVDIYKKDFTSKPKKRALTFFDQHDGKYYITQDGRNFFLSFFLKKSEISRFMQQRKGCKRNDKPEFKIKHLVYRFYTHRDGATKNRYSIENTVFSELDTVSKTEILQARQVHKILSYLNDVPSEVIDKKLFPLKYQNTEIENATQIIAFINENNLFPKCTFTELLNKEGEIVSKALIFNFEDCSYEFKIRVTALHKIILDIIRNPKREDEFYETLRIFSDFRDQFPEKLDEFARGNGSVEEINEYYTFKLKSSDYTRGKLASILDKFARNIPIDYQSRKELKERIATEPIELTYYNFYFQLEQKPRAEDQFMSFAVNYLIDKGVLKDVEWLLEKFEPEAIAKKNDQKNKPEIINVVKRIKTYNASILEGYRLCIEDGHALFRKNTNPELIFGIGQNTMRNLLIGHFRGQAIGEIIPKIIADLNKIKLAGTKGQALSFEQLELLNDKTTPRYLRLMMRNQKTLENETMSFARQKAKARSTSLIEYFTKIKEGDIQLTRKEINTQLIRCYKYFDWKYPAKNEFKFLRQNEYQIMSIYHYTLAKPDNTSFYLADLRKKLFVDIEKHLPNPIKEILETATTLDGLFISVLDATIKKLSKWNNRLPSMNLELMKDCMCKLGIHVPMVPVPDASNEKNLQQMEHLPFMLHPALVFMSLGYKKDSNIFSKFRDSPENSQGLISEHYQFQPYLNLMDSSGNKSPNTHKIIGSINNLKTQDTLLCRMAKEYLKQANSEIMKKMAKELAYKPSGDFMVNNLHNLELAVCTNKNIGAKPFRVMVKFKQLNDFMIITERPLIKLANQVFNRYPSEEKLTEAGITIKDGFYEIPYVHIKQEMDRMYHESLIVTDIILEWEKTIADKISGVEKLELINKAKQGKNGQKAFINFNSICQHANLTDDEITLLKQLRNCALHAKIPERYWTYQQKLKDNKIVKMLTITQEKLMKYEKKDAYYEALALNSKQ
jgi:hypothetical protein